MNTTRGAMTFTAAVIAVIISTSALGAQAIGTWISFRMPEGRYTVLMPGTPKLSAQEATAATGEKFPQYIASAADSESGAAYFVGYFDMTPTQTYTLTDGRDGMAKAVNGTVIGETKVTLSGYPGLDVTISLTSAGTDFVARARFYQVERRVYIVQGVIPRTGMTASVEKVAKFFDSFQVSKTPY